MDRTNDLKILIRGGGEMASGIAHRLRRCHMDVLISEIAAPTAVRRTLAFAEAIYEGAQTIEGITARRAARVAEIYEAWQTGEIPVVVDAAAAIRTQIKPAVIVDAIMAKKNLGTSIHDAALVIGVGPGFRAGVHVHAVIESNRGYHLGRVLWEGQAEPDTGVPAAVEGHAQDRLLRASQDGIFIAQRDIGDVVDAAEVVGSVEGISIRAAIPGMIRGILRSGVKVRAGMKVGDVDPRLERGYCYEISDKSRAIGGGVLEAILGALLI
jgi:xanthine dehydrogenase accessory factor